MGRGDNVAAEEGASVEDVMGGSTPAPGLGTLRASPAPAVPGPWDVQWSATRERQDGGLGV